jgi:diguanylate cyclase (GGDEF)-like protein
MAAQWAVVLLVVSTGAAQAAPERTGSLLIGRDVGSYSADRYMLYVEDPTRTLTIGDVTSPAMADKFRNAASRGSDINFGYSASAFWLALPVTVSADAPTRWVMEFAFPSLDRVEIYVPRSGGGFQQMVAGDMLPFSARPYPHRNLAFPLEFERGARSVIYVRVTSEGTLTIPVTLWQRAALHLESQISYALLSLYYGMVLAMLFYSLMLYFAVRDTTFLAFVGMSLAMLIAQSSFNGMAQQFLWPEFPALGNIAFPAGLALIGFFGSMYTRIFLGTPGRFPRIDKILIAFVFAFGCIGFGAPLLPYSLMAQLDSIAGILFCVFLAWTGIYCHFKGVLSARYFLAAGIMVMVGAAIYSMRNFGWIPTNAFTTYAFQVGSAIELLLLSFAQVDKINAMRLEKDRLTAESLKVKESVMDDLKRSADALEHRVTERTHELETANAELRKKEQQLQYLAQHDPLTGLANRTLLDDRVAQAMARSRRNGREIAILVADLDGFKAVNDLQGHVVGDLVLAMIAARFAECVRTTDTVARMGGDEFVIVVEDLQERADAERIAEKFIAAACKPADLASGQVQIGISVGIAYFPEHGEDTLQLIRHADAAMYASKTKGGNCWSIATS